jgi:hypothetical protein
MVDHRVKRVLILITFLATITVVEAADVKKEVLAVADSALKLISSENFQELSELMVEEAVSYTVSVNDGEYRLRVRTWAESRDIKTDDDIVERGFDPTVLVSGPLATVWYPYDFYLNGDWSHCGVDVFVLGLTENGWRILSMAWNAMQPPNCDQHPDGAP